LTLLLALPLAARAVEAPAAAAPAAAAAPDLWKNVPLFSYRYKADGDYFYNTKYAYQWAFGFNQAYDVFSPVVGSFYDTLRFKFTYGGRDWLVQAWKGVYGYGLFTGGEIGLYSKNAGFPLEQYASAATKDWIGMEFSIYHYQNKLFTRPMENTWWATGFKRYITSKDFARDYIIMDATLRFPNADMAAAFAGALAAKGFTKGSVTLDRSYNTERYAVNGSTVRFLWREKAD
ncbi:MAG: DUF4474 domain-containing protein, partial [Oscillospiraceae bacterium]|nr:DUF4474 domain-containing protein [Oscillospiraceae bacterium]